jgi:DNA-binding transcriptional ArsR family regulator
MDTFDAVPDGPGAADLVTLRRSNLALVLRRLRDHGPRSRARLATELGLTRSAASNLVSELAERGLVRVGVAERGLSPVPSVRRRAEPVPDAGTCADMAR